MVAPPDAAAVFAAGTLTVLTPCCLPVLPPLLAGSVGHRLRPLGIVAGSVLAFTALGVATATVAGLTPGSLRLPFTALMILFGAVLVDDGLNRAYSRYASRVAERANRATSLVDTEAHPMTSAFLLGTLLGVLWLPCVGPVLGGVLAYVGTSGDVFGSAGLLFTYGVGFSLPLLGVAYGGKRTAGGLKRVASGGGHPEVLRRVVGVVLGGTGVAMLFELDKIVLGLLT
jgi:cytochrome c biogenesis protein CcdA